MVRLDAPNIYVILDIPVIRGAGREPESVMEQAAGGGAKIFQLRYKGVDDGVLYEYAVKLAELARELGVMFIVNDRIGVALAAGADGVHLGEDDLPISAARKIAGENFVIGASARSFEAARRAEREGASYIGYGAIFPTGTKSDAVPGSIDTLLEIAQKVRIPVYAIGGINGDNVGKLVSYGIRRVCVGAGIIAAGDVYEATRTIWETINNEENLK